MEDYGVKHLIENFEKNLLVLLIIGTMEIRIIIIDKKVYFMITVRKVI